MMYEALNGLVPQYLSKLLVSDIVSVFKSRLKALVFNQAFC